MGDRLQAPSLSTEARASALAHLVDHEVDVLVIGGGVVGTGVALDAATRGLSVGLVEARDLGSGTSSRSSKLIHGGVRYLEQLRFGLVREALRERDLLLRQSRPTWSPPCRSCIRRSGASGSGLTLVRGCYSTTAWAGRAPYPVAGTWDGHS